MANKIKKVSINSFEDAVNSQYKQESTIDWNGISFTVKYNLSLREMMSFVDSVVKSCFNDEDGSFIPEVKDFAIRSNVYEYYTNISLPSNIEKRYELLYRCDLFFEIVNNIDKGQFNIMLGSIKEKISHVAQANIENITKRVNELCSIVDGLYDRFESMFSGVGGDDIKNFMTAFGDGVVDEDKIVKAIINTQME